MSVDRASELAFEHGMEAKPDKLWRVVWWRVWGKENQRLRCTDYFGDEQKAWEFAGVQTEAGYEVISVDVFALVPVEGSSSTSLVKVASTPDETTNSEKRSNQNAVHRWPC